MKIEFKINIDNDSPVYLQIVRKFKIMVARGIINNGDELPSRRELAIHLAINPNTVQRAYALLDEENLIITQNNIKSIAVINEMTVSRLKLVLAKDIAKIALDNAYDLGLNYDELINIISDMARDNIKGGRE